MAKCCEDCFMEGDIRTEIRKKAQGSSTCDYCGSRNVPTVDDRIAADCVSSWISNNYTTELEGYPGYNAEETKSPLYLTDLIYEVTSYDTGTLRDRLFYCLPNCQQTGFMPKLID